MSKCLYISEKPSVAAEFAKALKINAKKRNGYMESEEAVITWCVGHLVTMSYPDAYDPALKKWTMQTLPFLPKSYRYEVIPNVKKQFDIVQELLKRQDVDTIYVCTDSGREGEYIYRLVDQMAKVPDGKVKKRVWIDSQTEEEILRGIKEAKPLSAYDNLSEAAYLRAKEDYLMGINFSRILTLKYGSEVQRYLKTEKWSAISVGRVMTCVLGMVVRREREVRNFIKTPFYRIIGTLALEDEGRITGEFKAVEGSRYFNSPALYKENGFAEKESAQKLISELAGELPKYEENGDWIATDETDPEQRLCAVVDKVEKKKENKNPPLLYNLAELQNECAKMFKISPDETLKVVQELYEKKLVTYPRTDARVLSTAVAKEIYKNIKGLQGLNSAREFVNEILEIESYKNIAKTRYVNDSQITDHYAIIPTGQGLNSLGSLSSLASRIYDIIVKRFLSIFYPAAEYRKVSIISKINGEYFFTSMRVLAKEGYLKVVGNASTKQSKDSSEDGDDADDESSDQSLMQKILNLKKGMKLPVEALNIKEGETSPPKRYSSGTLILAMENAGQLIEDEELRAQIKGSGIGTSATRAEILNKLVKITYLSLNKKTQIITPTLLGEIVYEVVNASISSLLNADLTASWEKGLTYVSDGEITTREYMDKLEGFVGRRVNVVKNLNNQAKLTRYFDEVSVFYKK